MCIVGYKSETLFRVCRMVALVLFGFLFKSLVGTVAFAQGNLMLMQKRIVFEGPSRIAKVDYANIGEDSARYTVTLIHLHMKENGAIEAINNKDTNNWYADKYVRIFPRSIVLGPHEAQTMKIQLINTPDMLPGEYRSHLYFRAVPDEVLSGRAKSKDSSKVAVSVNIKPVFGMSIPLIIRVGKDSTTVKLTNLVYEKISDTLQQLKFRLNRSGKFSVFGDLKATYVSSNGKVKEIGKASGVAVYTPGTIRTCILPLKETRGIDFHKGKIRLIYEKQNEDGGTVMAEEELVLN